jgi:hypothetical protein
MSSFMFFLYSSECTCHGFVNLFHIRGTVRCCRICIEDTLCICICIPHNWHFLLEIVVPYMGSFRLRKTVGCLSVHFMVWMYSSFVSFSSVKKSSKLINPSKSHCSRNENKDLDFSTTTLSSKLSGSMILVVLIGDTGKLYLQCEFFLFFTTFCMIMSMNFGKFWIQMICVACYVFVHKLFDLCCMLCICPQTV